MTTDTTTLPEDKDALVQYQYPEIDPGRWITPGERSKIRGAVILQHRHAKAAFLRHFMAWIEEQARERGLGIEVLARRMRVTRGTVVRHFRFPEAMPLEHIISYQLALGLFFDFTPLPITRLSEMPGYKPPL